MEYSWLMQDVLTQLGLNDKEAKIYLILLEEGHFAASPLAKRAQESRTNTYMILESLEKQGLVTANDSRAVRYFKANDPVLLKQLLVRKQLELKQAQGSLSHVFPKLKSSYTLNELKPGVVYLEGLDGLRVMLDDMARSGDEALIIPSDYSPQVPEAWKVLQEGVNKRAKLGVRSRIIFPKALRKDLEFDRLLKQEMEIRFWGSREYPGELVVYGNKCVFTTYKPKVMNTILTDDVIAQTLRNLFEELWEQAES